MRISKSLKQMAVAMACVSIVAPQLSLAANPVGGVAVARATVSDVALQNGNLLAGQLVDPAGSPLPGAAVTVSRGTELVASTQTTADGIFAVRNLKAGVYTVNAGGAQGVYRVWSPNMAPPAAKPAVLMVRGETVNGQFVGGLLGPLGNPWVLGAIVGAAIAIPVALDDDDAS